MEARGTAKQPDAVWVIDPEYTTVLFEVRNLFTTLRGRFRQLSGTIARTGPAVGDCWIEAGIKAAGVNTGNARRDEHLRSRAFLDAETHSEIRFESSSVEKGTDRDTFRVKGLLTIRGKSRELTLDVTEVERSRSPQGKAVVYYTVVTKLNRFNFGVSYGRWFIGATVKVRIHVQAVEVA